MVCGVGNYTQRNHFPSYKCLLSNIYSLYLHPCVQDIYLLLVYRWCCSQKSNRSLIAAQVCRCPLVFFNLFYLFKPFFKHLLSPSSFLFKIPSFYNTLHRSVTCPPVPCDLHSLYTDSSGCDNLNSPSLYNNFTSNLPCPTKIWAACHPITRFVVALMDVGLRMCEVNTKASGLLPAPRTGHATTIMVFSLLIYSS